jgi:hypothetical protein
MGRGITLKNMRSVILIAVLALMAISPASAEQAEQTDPALLSFFDSLFKEFYFKIKEKNSDEFNQFCDKYRLEAKDEENQKTFCQVRFYHDLLTGNGASDCVTGGILKIPYFWHWIDPNPRHEILKLPDSTELGSLKPPAEFARYKSYADIDRVPSLFLTDLVSEIPGYYHPDCGEFYSFGWCSEREMAYCCIMSGYDYTCKIKQEGIHTWSEVWASFRTKDSVMIPLYAVVDNTFDYLRWIPLDSSVNQKEWLTAYGSGSNIDWYNEVFRSEEHRQNVRNIIVPLKARNRIEKQISTAFR